MLSGTTQTARQSRPFLETQKEEEEEEFYKLLPANKADHLCQLWQSCVSGVPALPTLTRGRSGETGGRPYGGTVHLLHCSW